MNRSDVKLCPENTNRGRLSTVDLFINLACFINAISKAADLNWLVQGGQLY